MADQIQHAFEVAGLGVAPFICVGSTEMVHDNGDGTTKAGGSCDFCGTGIRTACIIKSADGRQFKVGTDCVKKTGDEGLINMTRRAKREAKAAAQRAVFEAELQTQRDRNGGKTDWEVEEAARLEALKVKHAAVEVANMWIIDALIANGGNGAFVQSMLDTLKREPVNTLSNGALSVLCDIFCKGTRGKNREARFDEFWAKVAYKGSTWRVGGFLKEAPKPADPNNWIAQILFEAQQEIGPDNKRLMFCEQNEAEYLSLVGVCGAVARLSECEFVEVVGWSQDVIKEQQESYKHLIGEVIF